MNEVATEAASGGNKFATKEANITGLISLYSLGQCTQDLSSLDCNRCLRKAIAQVPDCCSDTTGVRILSPSCNIRFDLYPFYSSQKPKTEALAPPPAQALAPPPAPPIKGKRKLSSPVIASIVSSVVLCVLVVVVVRCFFGKSRLIRAKQQKNKALNDMPTVKVDLVKFSREHSIMDKK
ncbi:hypothetical protein M0R45_012999 [Rubus argutus]|uniref:Gnk2-homologous domain-containing protein n=1 Tax=Rubus argutus TaxID=59490 RepID=A0AAW1XI87_RUBAR